MSLTLKVISFNGQPCDDGKDIIINEAGGTIGRSDSCSLVLTDEMKLISRCHATIEFANDQYLLVDSSLAGTFIDDASTPISNAKVHLVDGMHITIGDYTIVCCISEDMSPFLSTTSSDPFTTSIKDDVDSDELKFGNPFTEEYSLDEDENNALLNNTKNNVGSPFIDYEQGQVKADDLLNSSENNLLLDSVSADFNDGSLDSESGLLDLDPDKGGAIDQGLLAENVSSLNDSFIPAEPIETVADFKPDEIPEDFNFEDFFVQDTLEPTHPIELPSSQKFSVDPNHAGSQTQISTEHEPSANTTDQSDDNGNGNGSVQLLQAFLRGAQIDQKQIDFKKPDEKMTRIGLMFRQFVDSTVAILRSRAEFKSLFRVSVTTIKSADNNPLKFAVTTDEAIKHLINDGQDGFKQSIDAIDESFNDMLNHQMAMQAGIQASLIEVLRKFDPAEIEKLYEQGFVFNKSSKCWDKYNKIYNHLSETVMDDFYGDAFADAYDKQIKKLKN